MENMLYYKQYCKIISKVLKEAKELYYEILISQKIKRKPHGMSHVKKQVN